MSRFLGIDFSGNHLMWRPGCSRSNVWISDVRKTDERLVLDRLVRVRSAIIDAEPYPIGKPVRYHENPPVQTGGRREAGSSGSIKLSRLVITIVVAVLICVFSVATSQAVDPQNKGQATGRRSLKTIIVDNYQPYTFMNEKGSPDGFSVEIVKAVAAVMDLDLEIRAGTWEQATKELERGTIDLLPMMAYSVERDKTFDFSVPHTIAYDAIFHRSGDKSLGSLKDLSGKKVIVMNKDAAHDYLLSSGLSKTMRLQLVDSLPEALRQLASGKGDAAIMPKLVGIITLKKMNLSNIIEPSPSLIDRYSRPFSFAVKEGDQALLERLNQGLGIIKTTGQYDAIYKKWFGGLEAPHIPWKSALQLIFLAGIILIAFAAWNVSLKHQVKSRTKDLEAEVTERKLKGEALRESEERYAGLVEGTHDLISRVDSEGRLVFVNRASGNVFGLSPDECMGRQIFDFVHPEDKARTMEWFRECVASRAAEGSIEYRQIAIGGRVHHMQWRSTFHYDGQWNLVSVDGIARDITDQKSMEGTLQKQFQFLQVILDAIPAPVFYKDARGFFLGCNKAYEEYIGIPRGRLVGMTVGDIAPKDLADVYRDADDALFRKGGRQVYETDMVAADGKRHDVIFNKATFPNPDGSLGGLVGTILDITERKRAEEALTRLAMAVDQAAEAIVITDTEGRIEYVNPSFERITGYLQKEAVGQSMRILKSGKQDEMFYRDMWGTISRGEVWRGHFINKKKDGTLYEEETIISPVRNASGKIINFVAGKRDITQDVKMQKQLQTAQRMESVGTLAGGIAHDFNNALTGIMGFGELMRLRLAGDSKSAADLDEILRCAERAATLTRQLLTFARRQVIEPVNLSLSTLVADLMMLIGKVVGEHIEVTTSLEKDVPTIHADRGQIEQVVMNLCLNARDAMPEGGRLVVGTEDVYLEEEYVRQNPYMRTGRYALLTVSDTGIGMDEKTCERVFEPFFTTKGPEKGTGLGLAMVYGIVKKHGGFIHLYSEPGKGTTFKVYFPAIEAQPDAVPEKRTEEIVRGGTETILLAEDEEAIRSFIERVLKEFGYNVLVARNGEEAIEMFRQHKEIVLAVLDVVMPRKGGKEAFEEMHKQNPRLKVIFMSGYSANAIHDSFVLIAGTPFLQKPFGPTILARKIREVLDRK